METSENLGSAEHTTVTFSLNHSGRTVTLGAKFGSNYHEVITWFVG